MPLAAAHSAVSVGVAEGVAGAIADGDAAIAHLLRQAGRRPAGLQQVGQAGLVIDAGDQQPLGLAVGQQLQALAQAVAAAGEDDDPIGRGGRIGHAVGDERVK